MNKLATITTEIRANMSAVTSTIAQICDKNGNFYFDELKATGLSRAAVMQAIAFLNESGHPVLKMRSEFGYWQDQTIYWNRAELMKAARS